MAESNLATLQLPQHDLASLSFCKAEPAAFAAWLEQLPQTNLGESSRLLYTALTELNRLPLAPDTRFELLEMLRPKIHDICRGLAKHYLNQPIVLPPKARNVAHLAQTLQMALATGYAITAANIPAARTANPRKALPMAEALHRGISDFSLALLRSIQLYQPAPKGLWHSLHQLHVFAIQERATDAAVADPLVTTPQPLTIRQAYCRALLLGSARVNQLRQAELREIFMALGEWVQDARIVPGMASQAGLVVQPGGDNAPHYRKFCDTSMHPIMYALDTRALVQKLQEQAKDENVESIRVNGAIIADNLLLHLVVAWSDLAERNYKRTEAATTQEVCLGLSAVHHYLSDGQSFIDLMGTAAPTALVDTTEKNRFMRESDGKQKADLWDSPYQMQFSNEAANKLKTIDKDVERVAQQGRAAEESERFQTTAVSTLDSSPAGYRLHWKGEVPTLLKAGEIIGLRASPASHWAVAAIRWVKPVDGGAEFGVEILSLHAQPWGGRVMPKVGEPGDFLRVLMLPEASAAGLPESLLTPRVGFRARQKVALQQKGEIREIRLQNKLEGTGAWCRFSYEAIGSAPRKQAVADTAHAGFDALWKTL